VPDQRSRWFWFLRWRTRADSAPRGILPAQRPVYGIADEDEQRSKTEIIAKKPSDISP